MRTPQYFKIRDDWWKISFVDMSLTEDLGECDYHKREIRISRKLENDRRRMEVIVHETIHASIPDLAEDAVDRTGIAVINALEATKLLPGK